MPDTKTKTSKKKQGKNSGGLGGGATSGGGIVQSVLDMQQQIGNEQTIKTVLGPDVPGQFKAMAGRGKGGSLFFARSTYKQVSKLLSGYAAKQGAKGGAWRRGQVATIDGLLDGWFAKDNGDSSAAGKTKRAAMKWLRPLVKQEQGALHGAKSKEQQTENQPENQPENQTAPEPEAPAPSWQQGNAPGGDRSGPTIGKRGWTKGTGGGDRGGVVIGGARGKKSGDDEAKQPESTGTKENYVDNNVDLDDLDDVSSVASPTVQSEEVMQPEEAKVPDAPTTSTGRKKNYVDNNVDNDVDLDDVSSIASPTVQSDEAQQEVAKIVNEESLSSTTVSPEAPKVEALPAPKYDEYKPLDEHYQDEFKKGGKHLVDVYNLGIQSGPERDQIAAALEASWARWKKPTFDKYWDKLVKIFGPPPTDEEEKYKGVDVSSVADTDTDGDTISTDAREQLLIEKKVAKGKLLDSFKAMGIKWTELSVTTVSSMDSDGNTVSSATVRKRTELRQIEAAKELAEGKTDPNAVKVKKKTTDEDRAKYKLKLGTSIRRGPQDEPLDTGPMASNASGSGFGIFVMSQAGETYVGSHKVGIFHHSSFLAGGNVAAAGELKAVSGKLQVLTNKSGHYKPSHENNMQVIAELNDAGIAPSSYKYRFFPASGKPTDYDSADEYLKTQNTLRNRFGI